MPMSAVAPVLYMSKPGGGAAPISDGDFIQKRPFWGPRSTPATAPSLAPDSVPDSVAPPLALAAAAVGVPKALDWLGPNTCTLIEARGQALAKPYPLLLLLPFTCTVVDVAFPMAQYTATVPASPVSKAIMVPPAVPGERGRVFMVELRASVPITSPAMYGPDPHP